MADTSPLANAIRHALARSTDAWNDGDLAGHFASHDPDFVMMTQDGPITGIETVRAGFARTYFAPGTTRPTLAMDNVAVRPVGPDFALMTGQYRLSGEGAPEQSGWVTVLWQRTAAGWRIIHDHSS